MRRRYDRARYRLALADQFDGVRVPDPASLPPELAGAARLLRDVHDRLVRETDAVELFSEQAWADAAFEYLQTRSGHRVSATRAAGVVTGFRLVAGQDGTVRIRNPFGDRIAFWNTEVKVADGVCTAFLERGQALSGNTLVGVLPSLGQN